MVEERARAALHVIIEACIEVTIGRSSRFVYGLWLARDPASVINLTRVFLSIPLRSDRCTSDLLIAEVHDAPRSRANLSPLPALREKLLTVSSGLSALDRYEVR